MILNGEQEIKILMIDDHPLIIEGYKEVLAHLSGNTYFVIDTAHTCDLAWEKIKSNQYDILFLDISFSKEAGNRLISGDDLGLQVRKKYPQLKIIILTQIDDAFHLKNLMTTVRPEGFLLKQETNPKLLTNCVQSVIGSIPFFSPKIAKILHSGTTDNLVITENDRIILHQLSLGTKTKNLHHYLPLSHRAVEDRKRKLKEIFGANDDKTLLANAKAQGYI